MSLENRIYKLETEVFKYSANDPGYVYATQARDHPALRGNKVGGILPTAYLLGHAIYGASGAGDKLHKYVGLSLGLQRNGPGIISSLKFAGGSTHEITMAIFTSGNASVRIITNCPVPKAAAAKFGRNQHQMIPVPQLTDDEIATGQYNKDRKLFTIISFVIRGKIYSIKDVSTAFDILGKANPTDVLLHKSAMLIDGTMKDGGVRTGLVSKGPSGAGDVNGTNFYTQLAAGKTASEAIASQRDRPGDDAFTLTPVPSRQELNRIVAPQPIIVVPAPASMRVVDKVTYIATGPEVTIKGSMIPSLPSESEHPDAYAPTKEAKHVNADHDGKPSFAAELGSMVTKAALPVPTAIVTAGEWFSSVNLFSDKKNDHTNVLDSIKEMMMSLFKGGLEMASIYAILEAVGVPIDMVHHLITEGLSFVGKGSLNIKKFIREKFKGITLIEVTVNHPTVKKPFKINVPQHLLPPADMDGIMAMDRFSYGMAKLGVPIPMKEGLEISYTLDNVGKSFTWTKPVKS